MKKKVVLNKNIAEQWEEMTKKHDDDVGKMIYGDKLYKTIFSHTTKFL